MRRVLLLGYLVALAVVAIPGPSASVSMRLAEVATYRPEPKPAPEPRAAPPAPAASFTLTCDAWECLPAGLGIVRPSYGRAAYALAPSRNPAVRKRPQVWEYG